MRFESPPWKERLQHWKLAQEKSSCASESEKFLEVDDSPPTEAEWDQLDKYEFPCQVFWIYLLLLITNSVTLGENHYPFLVCVEYKFNKNTFFRSSICRNALVLH